MGKSIAVISRMPCRWIPSLSTVCVCRHFACITETQSNTLHHSHAAMLEWERVTTLNLASSQRDKMHDKVLTIKMYRQMYSSNNNDVRENVRENVLELNLASVESFRGFWIVHDGYEKLEFCELFITFRSPAIGRNSFAYCCSNTLIIDIKRLVHPLYFPV